MNRKITITVCLLLLIAGTLSASGFDGYTAIGGNYEYRDGHHLGGLSVSNEGYVYDCPVGYHISANADFNLK